MRGVIFSVGVAAFAVGSVFGYGDTDTDPDGIKYNDTEYYVQCQGYAGGGGNWETGYIYDKGGLWYKGGTYSFATNTTFWSTGVGPNQYPDMDYYINGGRQIYIAASSAYAQAPTNQTFQGHSLTVGAHGRMRLDGNKYAKTAYGVKFPHLYLRPTSMLYAWAALPFCFGAGEMTILSTDVNYPAAIIGGWNGQGYYFQNNLIGEEDAQLHLQGAYEERKHEIGDDLSFMEFSGDNTEYYGSINVGLNVTVRLGNGGFPNAAINVTGISTKNFNPYPYCVTNVEYTALGVCETAGTKPEIGELTVADGVTFECSGMVDNGNGFYVWGYKQEGTVILDFGGKLLSKRLAILTVPVASDTQDALNPNAFTIKNLVNEEYSLVVKEDAETGDQILTLVPGGADYVTLTANDTVSWTTPVDVNINSFYGTGHWSDGQAPHADADYLVSGQNRYLYVPIWYAMGRDAAGRKSGYADFYGGSLTLASGGAFRPSSYKDAVAGADFQFYFKDLRLASGGCIRQNDGNQAIFFSSKGKLTIAGTDDNPGFIASGTNNNTTNNNLRIFINSTVTGEGTVVLTGGNTAEILPSPHWLEFNGDNSGFTGTMVVAPATSSEVGMATRCNLVVRYGASGLPNGSLVMEDGEAHLGVSKSAVGKLVPLKHLTLVEGNTLDVGSMMTNNNMCGFLVTESYEQTGVVTVNVENVSLSARAIKVLRIATTAGTLDASKFVLLNDPDTDAELVVTSSDGYQTLQIVSPDVKTSILIDNNTRFKAIATTSPGDVLDPNDYVMVNTTKADSDTDWYRFYSEGDTLYVENYKCLITNAYDVSMYASDYHCTNEVTKLQNESFLQAQNWTDKQVPHSGASYVNRGQLMFLTTSGPQSFGGDSLTLGGICSTSRGYAYLRDDGNSDITVNDFRILDGAVLQCAGGTNNYYRGLYRILSSDYPVWLFYASKWANVHLTCTLLGGETRVLGTKIDGADSGDACTRTVWLDGDASEYKGTLDMTNTFILAVGSYGLPKGTAKMSTSTAGIMSADAKKAVEVGTLKMASGSWIRATTSAFGLSVQHLDFAGTVNLDFGTKALAQDITVLTVPEDEVLTTSMFTIPTPLAGYNLAVVSADGFKRLVYSTSVTPTKKGAAVILK